ncbi:CMF_collapsed_G0007720.mRNA.1.CDS.1 [Saccharomyces cerevisiae]|nr:CMF_collapsed_G0007720.mRNA.1.CDS.1 [Saccharomyces cerevisiae]
MTSINKGTNPTVNAIKGLLYNGGSIYAFLYFVIAMFVEPTLQKQYQQRNDFFLVCFVAFEKNHSAIAKTTGDDPSIVVGVQRTE